MSRVPLTESEVENRKNMVVKEGRRIVEQIKVNLNDYDMHGKFNDLESLYESIKEIRKVSGELLSRERVRLTRQGLLEPKKKLNPYHKNGE